MQGFQRHRGCSTRRKTFGCDLDSNLTCRRGKSHGPCSTPRENCEQAAQLRQTEHCDSTRSIVDSLSKLVHEVPDTDERETPSSQSVGKRIASTTFSKTSTSTFAPKSRKITKPISPIVFEIAGSIFYAQALCINMYYSAWAQKI